MEGLPKDRSVSDVTNHQRKRAMKNDDMRYRRSAWLLDEGKAKMSYSRLHDRAPAPTLAYSGRFYFESQIDFTRRSAVAASKYDLIELISVDYDFIFWLFVNSFSNDLSYSDFDGDRLHF